MNAITPLPSCDPASVMPYNDFLAFRRSLPHTPRLERQTVRARGIEFAVFTSPPVGSGATTPLVCINGGMLYDHSMLWPALSPLAIRRQLILYDQRGRGESSAPEDPAAATIEDDAADVGALRRALGVRRWDVLGHSWGGGIAMLAAAGDAAAVQRMVLVDPVGATSDWMPVLRRAVLDRLAGAEHDAVAAISEESLGKPDPALHSAYARAVYPAWFADPDLAARFRPPHALSATGAAVLARLRREGYDWRSRLGGVSTPTLVLHGALDPLPPIIPLAISRTDSYILKSVRQIVVLSSGHMPFWEAPERFFSLIESFL